MNLSDKKVNTPDNQFYWGKDVKQFIKDLKKKWLKGCGKEFNVEFDINQICNKYKKCKECINEIKRIDKLAGDDLIWLKQ